MRIGSFQGVVLPWNDYYRDQKRVTFGRLIISRQFRKAVEDVDLIICRPSALHAIEWRQKN
jgi:hypothetical protein